ncbi:MAG: hypothetical protein WKF68_02570 [Daejeonella sp.]
MKYIFIFCLLVDSLTTYGQHLKLKKRSPDALSGSEFSKSIRDTSLDARSS